MAARAAPGRGPHENGTPAFKSSLAGSGRAAAVWSNTLSAHTPHISRRHRRWAHVGARVVSTRVRKANWCDPGERRDTCWIPRSPRLPATHLGESAFRGTSPMMATIRRWSRSAGSASSRQSMVVPHAIASTRPVPAGSHRRGSGAHVRRRSTSSRRGGGRAGTPDTSATGRRRQTAKQPSVQYRPV